MKTIVIGGGNIAYFTARALLAGGHQVSIIVRSEEEARRFSRSLDKAVVIHGDGTSIQLLEDAGAMSADSFLAITPHDEDNLIGCQIATGKFGIQNTMAVINDPDNVEAFRRLGITSLLSTTDLISSIIEKKNSFSSVIQILPLGDGSIMTVEIALTEKSPANGQALRDVKLQEGVLIVAIERSGELIIPRG
jgi:trk system potassium uptake protein TrkA